MVRQFLKRRSVLKMSVIGAAQGLLGDQFSFVRRAEAEEPSARKWWKEAVVYQIFPRSFADSNGDGIGDLAGIIDKLDYLAALGVNVVWLCPHYDTPNVDSGYDIRNYRKINPDFGTMADFDSLVQGLHQRGMKLIVDLVVNHTSDEHVWFQESKKSRDNPYRDYYIWRDGRDGGPPNNYPSFFAGDAWEKDDKTGQYYLHYFAKQQPDLNWENPKVRQEVYDIMHFWLDKGVSGFRMDVIPLISKPEKLRNLTDQELKNPEYVFGNGPHLHQYLHEMTEKVGNRSDYMSVGEGYGVTREKTSLFVSEARHELDMIFRFDLAYLGRDDWKILSWSVPDVKDIITGEDISCGSDGWAAPFLENHDTPRSVSYFGDGSQASAKALALLLFSRRGTPFIFQGQEIGMTNIPFHTIDDFEDVHAKGIWSNNVPTGKFPASKVLRDLATTSRENARTPMQWANGSRAGFTTGTPWYRVNPNADRINVMMQQQDPESVLAVYRRLIAIRAAHPELIYGQFCDIDPKHPALCVFVRGDEGHRYLFLINLTAHKQKYAFPKGFTLSSVLLNTHGKKSIEKILPFMEPWEGGIYLLEPA